jgi:hypothetical protein
VDFRPILPETRFQPALDAQMIQLQFDYGHVSGEIPANIGGPDVKSG